MGVIKMQIHVAQAVTIWTRFNDASLKQEICEKGKEKRRYLHCSVLESPLFSPPVGQRDRDSRTLGKQTREKQCLRRDEYPELIPAGSIADAQHGRSPRDGGVRRADRGREGSSRSEIGKEKGGWWI